MRNFIFDLYGTLADIRTDEYSQKFWNRFTGYAAETFGAGEGLKREFSAQLNVYGGYAEPDICAVLKIAIENSGGRITARQSREAAAVFRALSCRRLKLYSGAENLLKSLQSKGAQLFLLSNAQAAFTMPELEKLNLIKYFKGVELSSQFGQKKPSPAFFNHIIEKYSLAVSESIYIGNDISSDIIPAGAINLKTAYIHSGISPQSDSIEYAASVADFATDSFAKLTKFLLGEVS